MSIDFRMPKYKSQRYKNFICRESLSSNYRWKKNRKKKYIEKITVFLTPRKEQPKLKKFDLQECKLLTQRQSTGREKARGKIQGKPRGQL